MNNGRGGRRRGAGRPPGARNKATLAREAGAKSLTELAQEKTENALNVLESIMNDENSSCVGPRVGGQRLARPSPWTPRARGESGR